MRTYKESLLTSGIVIVMTMLGWRYGYTAASRGERSDVGGAIFVALAFAILFGILLGMRAIWRMATMSGAGVSPLRYVMLAMAVLAVGFVMLATLSPFVQAGDSYSLGIVFAVLLGVIYFLARRCGLIDPNERVNLMRPPDNEHVM